MKNLSDVVDFLSQRAPLRLAEKWDNVGLLLGDPTSDLSGIVACIELSSELIEFAKSKEANLIITHHPIFFKGAKKLRFTDREDEAKWIRELVKSDISLFCMHTNFDRAPNALHDHLFRELGLQNCKPLEDLSKSDVREPHPPGAGYGIRGEYAEEKTLDEFLSIVREKFDLNGLRFSGDKNTSIRTVGFVSGSGMFMWHKAASLGLDIYLSGDVKHHEALDSINSGLNVLDVGHFGAEKHFANVVREWLAEESVSVDTFEGRDPFEFV